MRKACLTAISVALLVGCSTDITGDAIADSPTDQAFDPCTIPDTTITAAGLDPASKDSMADKGYTTPGWSICGWESIGQDDWYTLDVYFTLDYDLNDVRGNPQNSGFEGVEIAGRSALVYQSRVTDTENSCEIAFDTAIGLALFSASRKGSSEFSGDLCEIVVRHTRSISPAVPKS